MQYVQCNSEWDIPKKTAKESWVVRTISNRYVTNIETVFIFYHNRVQKITPNDSFQIQIT